MHRRRGGPPRLFPVGAMCWVAIDGMLQSVVRRLPSVPAAIGPQRRSRGLFGAVRREDELDCAQYQYSRNDGGTEQRERRTPTRKNQIGCVDDALIRRRIRRHASLSTPPFGFCKRIFACDSPGFTG